MAIKRRFMNMMCKIHCLSTRLAVVVLLCAVATVEAEPVYVVKKGDTLCSIARACGLDYGQICKSNGKPQGWNSIRPGQKIIVGELLDESGNVSLFAWKTASDAANKPRNSLFMRRHTATGTDEWQLVMTAQGDWKLADGMDEWCNGCARGARIDFEVVDAKLSKDGKSIWMVCNPHTYTYFLVCSLELATKKFRVLIDGDSVDEQADGTLFVEGKKTYLNDEKGEPLGAAWYNLWITPEGKVVRKTKPVGMAERQMEMSQRR